MDSENPLYERKPQEADQIIVACGTTTGGNYVIDRCGSSCLCPVEQEIFKGNCVNKCNEGYVRQANGECTCPQGLPEVDNQCQCPDGKELATEGPYDGLCTPICTGGRIRTGGICKCPETQELEDGTMRLYIKNRLSN